MVGFMLAAIGACSAIVQGVLVAPAVRRFGERPVLLAGMLAGALGFVIYAVAPTGTAFMAGVPVVALWGLASPAAQALMTRHIGADEQCELQGANGSVLGIAMMVGPTMFAATFAYFIGGGVRWHANALLDEAGWKMGSDGIRVAEGAMFAEDGTRFSLELQGYTNYEPVQRTEEFIVENLKAVGIEARIQIYDFSIIFGTFEENSPRMVGDYDMLIYDRSLSIQPQGSIENYYYSTQIPSAENPTAGNQWRWQDPKVDAYIDAAGGTFDLDARKDAYCGIGEQIVNELPQVYVYTHGHFDHVDANQPLKDATGAEIVIHELDAAMLHSANEAMMFTGKPMRTSQADILVKEGDLVSFGNINLKVLHTPGHTPGGISLVMEGQPLLYVGDTLFAGSIGRTDFPGGDFDTLIRGVRQKLFTLADHYSVYPGHGPVTTIGQERKYNPFF